LESQRTTRRSEFPPTEDEKRVRGRGGGGDSGAARKDKGGRRNPRTSLLPTGYLFRYLSASTNGTATTAGCGFLQLPTNLDQCYLESAGGVISIADAPCHHYGRRPLSRFSLVSRIIGSILSLTRATYKII